MKLRHAPLLVVREMARHEKHRVLVADTLDRVIQRPDEMTELLAIYWADALGPMQQRKRQPVSAQIKKGLARALTKFDAYQLAKYDRDGAVRIRDVLFLVHAKPKDADQEKIWKQLVDGKLASPDTWEVSLSSGKDKRETFERLIAENKLGGLALLAQSAPDAEGRGAAQHHRGRDRGDADGSYPALSLHRGGALCAGFRARARSRDAEVDQGLCAACRPHAAIDRRVGIDVPSAFRAVGDDACGSGLRSGDPGARGLRRGGDLHVQSETS